MEICSLLFCLKHRRVWECEEKVSLVLYLVFSSSVFILCYYLCLSMCMEMPVEARDINPLELELHGSSAIASVLLTTEPFLQPIPLSFCFKMRVLLCGSSV